ncbi:DUF6009 family protein [Streptomyces sp. NPDC046821]|uniref:DUF6009 family protein n=1 Tax=Streptomyces sp. NPDC046821 TaxID=3154702 RepID=UPI0033F4D8C7
MASLVEDFAAHPDALGEEMLPDEGAHREELGGEKRMALEHEDGIVWTEDAERMDYVRQSVDLFATTRRKPVAWNGSGRRVGYAVLNPDAPSGDEPGRFARRVFWVKNYDRSEQPKGTYRDHAPSEAVDPRTVAPGVWGELTERAWGSPLSEE